MSEPFLGEIKVVSFDFAPKGWAQCNGQLLPINQNQALFSLLGTMYGGDGRTNFALPNFRGRLPLHVGAGFIQGQAAGAIVHTLTISEMPTHTHQVSASPELGDTEFPTNGFWAGIENGYSSGSSNLVTMHPSLVSSVGSSQPHENRMPYLVLNFVIALQGIFPSRN